MAKLRAAKAAKPGTRRPVGWTGQPAASAARLLLCGFVAAHLLSTAARFVGSSALADSHIIGPAFTASPPGLNKNSRSLVSLQPLERSDHQKSRSRVARPATAADTIVKKMIDLDMRVQAVEKPDLELYWRVLAYCTACRTPWCKLPWRRNTCLMGDAKAEGSKGNRCDMPWETYTDLLSKAVPLISRQKAQVLTRECWKTGDADPSGIGVVTVAIVPRPAADGYCTSLSQHGIQCSVVPDSFFKGGPSGN
ncbi:unnamed protein product, partial [Polarella glacialis]